MFSGGGVLSPPYPGKPLRKRIKRQFPRIDDPTAQILTFFLKTGQNQNKQQTGAVKQVSF
jgi:hypothetical protein